MAQTEPDELGLESLLFEDEAELSVVISDPRLPDNPMIYVSEEFEAQAGCAPEEAVGRNRRFLQGPNTDPHAVNAIREALKARTTFTIDLLNYRKNETSFTNRLRIRPLYDDRGELQYYVGVQNPI